jgi:predicted RNA polymerase sigma factor
MSILTRKETPVDMQCSAEKFLASQALYGAQIAHPNWTHEQLVEEAIKLSRLLIRRLEKGKKKK